MAYPCGADWVVESYLVDCLLGITTFYQQVAPIRNEENNSVLAWVQVALQYLDWNEYIATSS